MYNDSEIKYDSTPLDLDFSLNEFLLGLLRVGRKVVVSVCTMIMKSNDMIQPSLDLDLSLNEFLLGLLRVGRWWCLFMQSS